MSSRASVPFTLMLKPAGATCNLACEYCYYVEKAALYPGSAMRMEEATLERVTAAYLQAHPGPEVEFMWQGGEPLLMGVEFFRRSLELQAQYAQAGQRVSNTLQTNGTLVTEEWAEFFAANGFLLGVSLDGPPDLHDRYRRDRGGGPSYTRAVQGLRRLQERGVEVNVLVTVNRTNAEHPVRVYRHLVELGFRHLQFIPVVERRSPEERKVTPWSVRAEQFGAFLCEIFDYWAQHDVGQVFVQLFEEALGVWVGRPPALCNLAPVCGNALVVEHNGDLYACDHFVTPAHRRGQVTPEGLAQLVESPEQQSFGNAKAELSDACRDCAVLRWCHGDCPKHRLRLVEGQPISYLCEGYRKFFTHSTEVLRAMANEVRAGRPASGVMEVLQMREG